MFQPFHSQMCMRVCLCLHVCFCLCACVCVCMCVCVLTVGAAVDLYTKAYPPLLTPVQRNNSQEPSHNALLQLVAHCTFRVGVPGKCLWRSRIHTHTQLWNYVFAVLQVCVVTYIYTHTLQHTTTHNTSCIKHPVHDTKYIFSWRKERTFYPWRWIYLKGHLKEDQDVTSSNWSCFCYK